MKDWKTNYGSLVTNTWPQTVAKNASGSSAVDGTPFCADLINDLWGWQAYLMNLSGITPSGVSDTYTTSDVAQAIRRAGQQPGLIVNSCLNATMLALCRFLPLNGQVVSITSYPDLVNATYCGDANNASAPAFYKTSDAAGNTRSTAGTYFVLPDARGLVLRGVGMSAKNLMANLSTYYTGGSLPGAFMADAMMGHWHQVYAYGTSPYTGFGFPPNTGASTTSSSGASGGWVAETPISDGTHGTPTIAGENRPASLAAQLCITY